MDHSHIQLPTIVPDLSCHEAHERLEDEITELPAHININAANYDLLVLIGSYDEDKGWVEHGLASCAHWLQWRCGTNLGVAREKVRAMTRIAKPKNEACLLNVARRGTAHHIEQMVRNYRR